MSNVYMCNLCVVKMTYFICYQNDSMQCTQTSLNQLNNLGDKQQHFRNFSVAKELYLNIEYTPQF